MKNRTFYINVALSLLLIGILVLFAYKLLQNKEFEKTFWDFEIHISDQNQVKLMDYSIGNSRDYIAFALYDVNRDNNPFLLKSSDVLETYMSTSEDRKLYPDQLSISYYSFSEKKFYQYDGALLYNKIRNAGWSFPKGKSLILTLLPKGKIKLSVRDDEDKGKEKFIQNVQAKTIRGSFALLNKGDYSVDNIHTIEEYADLVTKKYPYKISFSTNDVDELHLYSFAGKAIEPPTDRYEKNILPQNIDVHISTPERSTTVRYYFDEKEILSAFEELSTTSSPEFLGKIDAQKKEVFFYLTNGSKTIYLKNKYPQQY